MGIYEGYTKTDGEIHGNRASVIVDRPQKDVVLVLSAYEPVLWNVNTTPETTLSAVWVAGYNAERTEVIVNGERVQAVIKPDLDMGYDSNGPEFRKGVSTLIDAFGTDSLSGYVGAYAAKSGVPLEIKTAAQNDPNLSADPLLGMPMVEISALPASFQRALGIDPVPVVNFNEEGFSVSYSDGNKVSIPATLDVPEISWPSNGVYDTERGVVYGATLGGEGYIYAGDPRTGKIGILMSADNFDISSLFYQAEEDRLILTLTHGPEMAFGTIRLPKGDIRTKNFPMEKFVGLTDLYDVGNGPGPAFDVLAASGDEILVRAKPRFPAFSQIDAQADFVANLKTGEVMRIANH